MSGDLEAAGALATAGLAAGAIEGREGGGAGEGACLNCGAKLEGAYCSQCGQHAHPHRKLTHVVEEFVHGIVHFDTKAWRTLPMVIFRPGTLTRNYVYGKRARYISPIALFLFTIFFMFFVFAVLPPSAPSVETDPAEVRAQLADARERLAESERALEQVRNAPPDEGSDLVARMTESAVRNTEGEVSRLERRLAELEGRPLPAEESAVAPSADEEGGGTWQDTVRDVGSSDDFVVIRGMDSLNEKVREKFENPELALYKIQQAGYKFSFLLAPLSLPFIALLFLWKRGVTLYDHMAYALYALSFASLLFVAIVTASLSSWTSWLGGWLMFVALPVHTYFHLKGAYALGWFSALWRTFFMLFFALIVLLIFIVLIVVLGLAG